MTERELTPEQESTARQVIENLRQAPFSDERAQKLSEKWARLNYVIPPQTKDQIGILLLRHILKIDEETIESFLNNPSDIDSRCEVGSKFARFSPSKNGTDGESFWKEVAKLEPEIVNKEELAVLIEEDKEGDGAIHLVYRFDFDLQNSPVLRRIDTNAHAYK